MVKIIGPVLRKIPKLGDVKKQAEKLGERTFEQTKIANVFFSDIADFFLFLGRTTREAFSRDFEFKEFFRQCYLSGIKPCRLFR